MRNTPARVKNAIKSDEPFTISFNLFRIYLIALLIYFFIFIIFLLDDKRDFDFENIRRLADFDAT